MTKDITNDVADDKAIVLPTQSSTNDITTALVRHGLRRLVEKVQDNPNYDPVHLLNTALAAKKSEIDIALKEVRLRQHQEGVITSGDAIGLIEEYVNGLHDSILSIAEKHGIDGQGLFCELIEAKHRLDREIILERANVKALLRIEREIHNEEDE